MKFLLSDKNFPFSSKLLKFFFSIASILIIIILFVVLDMYIYLIKNFNYKIVLYINYIPGIK